MSHHVFLPPESPESFVGWMLDDVVSPARCAELVAGLDRRGFAATGGEYPADYRNNDRLVVDDPALAAWLFECTRERLPTELTIDGERWVLDSLNPRFRACRYAGGQSFCIHRDGPYAPSVDIRSHLTLQIYLDDDPARLGGRTRFYADPRGATTWAAIDPRIGSAIVFAHRAWHDGEPVSRGIKHVLRTDVIYRRVAGRPVDDTGVLYRHRGYAWHVIACRDGSLASAGRDGTIRRLARDPARATSTGTPAVDATLELGVGSITRLAEASDGRIWAGSRSGTLMVIEGLRSTHVADDLGAILDLAARPDGGVVASTSRGTLVAFERNGARAWELRAHDGWAWSIVRRRGLAGYLSAGHDGKIVDVDDTGRTSHVLEIGAPLRSLACTDDGVLAGGTDGVVHRVGLDGSVHSSWAAHDAAITSIAVSPSGQLATAGEDARIHVWRGRACVDRFTCRDFVTSVAWSTGNTLLSSSYDGVIGARVPRSAIR